MAELKVSPAGEDTKAAKAAEVPLLDHESGFER